MSCLFKKQNKLSLPESQRQETRSFEVQSDAHPATWSRSADLARRRTTSRVPIHGRFPFEMLLRGTVEIDGRKDGELVELLVSSGVHQTGWFYNAGWSKATVGSCSVNIIVTCFYLLPVTLGIYTAQVWTFSFQAMCYFLLRKKEA